MISVDNMIDLGEWAFKNISKVLLSEGIKRLLPKPLSNKLENLVKENKQDEFIDKLEDILSVNENIKKELLKLQSLDTQITNINQTNNGDGNIGQIIGNVTQNFSNHIQDYEKYYKKAIYDIKQCSCNNAISSLNKYIEESTDYVDAQLFLIACEFHTKKITNEKVDNYIEYLNRNLNNFLSLSLLVLIHIDYCKSKRKRIDGLTTNQVIKKLKSMQNDDDNYTSTINCLLQSCSIDVQKILS